MMYVTMVMQDRREFPQGGSVDQLMDNSSFFSPPNQRLRHTPPPDFQPPYFPPPYPIHDFNHQHYHQQPSQVVTHQDPYSLHFYNNNSNNNYTQHSMTDPYNNDRTYLPCDSRRTYTQQHRNNNTLQLIQQQHSLDLSSRDASSLFGLAGSGVGGGVMHSINGLALDDEILMQVCDVIIPLFVNN